MTRLLLLTVLLAAGAAGAAGGEVEIRPEEPFRLKVGEEARLPDEDLSLRFDSVVGDSRCPKDVTCIWEGDAEIELTLSRGEEEATLRLHTHGGAQYPRETSALGCTVALKALDPDPVSTRPIESHEYVATLVVGPLGTQGGGRDPG